MSIHGQLEIKRHKRENAEMDITPMIDIVFLLLAFFVVVSTMDPKRNVKMPLSEVASRVPEEQCVLIYVDKPAGSQDAVILYYRNTGSGMQEVELSGTEEEQSEEVTKYVRETLNNNDKLEYVMIKAHGDSKNGLIDRIKRAAVKGADGKPIELLVGVENNQKK